MSFLLNLAGEKQGAFRSHGVRFGWSGVALLAAPRQEVPGTTMLASVPNAAQREAIITYLNGVR